MLGLVPDLRQSEALLKVQEELQRRPTLTSSLREAKRFASGPVSVEDLKNLVNSRQHLLDQLFLVFHRDLVRV